MKRLFTLIVGLFYFLSAYPEKIIYNFKSEPLSEALSIIAEQHPELKINFIYNELDKYKVSKILNTDDPYKALRQLTDLNPVSVIQKGDRFYVEALQHGKYLFNGHVIGNENEPVIAASVLLLNPKDSTVITYGLTDNAGSFLIPCDRNDVIAKLSCIGYKTLYIPLKSSFIGKIKMQQLPVALKGMTVAADNVRLYADKSVYLPSQRQKNASTNAIDLLRHLAIPQISINPVDGVVSDMFGKKIKIFINSMEASQEELEGLRTEDVKKVEFLEFPDDPRFQGVEKAVNFIVRQYIYGGYTKVTIDETTLNGFSNKSSLFSKFSFKNWTCDLYSASNNYNSHHHGTSTDATFRLKDGDGNNYDLNRKELLKNSRLKTDQFPVTLRLSYNNDKMQIRNTVGFTHNNIRKDFQEGELSVSTDNGDDKTFSKDNPVINNSLAYNGLFYISLPAGLSLNLTPKFNYTHRNDLYSYSISNSPTLITRKARENAFFYRVDFNINKQFNQNHALSIGANGGDWINKLSYIGTDNYSESFHLGFIAGLVNYKFSNQRVSLNTRIGVCTEPSSINSIHDSWTYPFGGVNFSFSPNPRHSLFSNIEYSYSSPTISLKTPDILQQNEYMYISGNPHLKGNGQMGLYLSYTWSPSNIISMNLYGMSFLSFKRMLLIYEQFNDGLALLRTFTNNGNQYKSTIGIAVNWKLLDGAIQIYANPKLSFHKSTGIFSQSCSPFSITAQATYYLNKFYFQLYYQSRQKTIQDIQPGITTYRNFHHFSVGWADANWNIRLTAANIFNKGWEETTQSIRSQYYSAESTDYGVNWHSRLNLTATYTFGYGKKVVRGNEVYGQDDASSAILK